MPAKPTKRKPHRKILFHLTWDCNVASILKNGLIPNHRPNQWHVEDAKLRSKRDTFLCTQNRLAYWGMTYREGWVQPPREGAQLVCLRVCVPATWLRKDRGTYEDENGVLRPENYAGDFRCRRTIPPHMISPIAVNHKTSRPV